MRRSPVTSVREGAPLTLEFQVSRIDPQQCEPLPGALVDIWPLSVTAPQGLACDPERCTYWLYDADSETWDLVEREQATLLLHD